MIVGPCVRKVTRLGQSVLREPTRALKHTDIVTAEIRRLVEEMAVTMAEYDGVGIAANQVGEPLSLFLMALPTGSSRYPAGIDTTVVFNPTVRFLSDEIELDWEGCLSVPGLRGQVPRRKALELSGLDLKGKPFTKLYEGFPARVVQHECDHLAGLVYLDRMTELKTLSYVSKI